jgi:hypothetical protein
VTDAIDAKHCNSTAAHASLPQHCLSVQRSAVRICAGDVLSRFVMHAYILAYQVLLLTLCTQLSFFLCTITSKTQAFFDFLGNAYRCFLDGDDAGYAALESDLVGSFEHQNSLIAADVQQLQERNAALRSETAAVLSRARALPELQARQKDFKSDLEKFQVRT